MKVILLLFLNFFFITVLPVHGQDTVKVDITQVNDSIVFRDSLSTEQLDTTKIDTTKTDSIVDISVKMDSIGEDSVAVSRKIREKEPVKIRLSKIDSISLAYTFKMEDLRKEYREYKYMGSDTLANPYYFFIFAPPAYYAMPMHRLIGELSPRQEEDESGICFRLRPEGNIVPLPLLREISTALSDVYTTSPQLITENEKVNFGTTGLRKDVNHEVRPNIKLAEKVNAGSENFVDNYKADDWNIVVHRPNFWKFKANFAFKIMQYFYSDNWYKGGENHYSWLASSVLEANYNNKQKITFDNKLEMRLGFQSSKGDSKHKYRSNSDQLRLTNKFGLRATKHWYYTLMLQSWTQFYPSYKKNDPKVYSDFMSPLESILTLGMDYKLNVKNFNLSATISPFAGNFKYVDRKSLSPSFGLDADKHTKFDFGSNITIRYNWNIMKNVSWSGRIFYFTDYETTRVEWENTFNLKINKFLSTTVYVYPRFDDGVQRKEGQSFFQFHENLSLGFDYNF